MPFWMNEPAVIVVLRVADAKRRLVILCVIPLLVLAAIYAASVLPQQVYASQVAQQIALLSQRVSDQRPVVDQFITLQEQIAQCAQQRDEYNRLRMLQSEDFLALMQKANLSCYECSQDNNSISYRIISSFHSLVSFFKLIQTDEHFIHIADYTMQPYADNTILLTVTFVMDAM